MNPWLLDHAPPLAPGAIAGKVKNPVVATLKTIADALGVNIQALIADDAEDDIPESNKRAALSLARV
jgi:transcriptional regulator with XRE-family HTH domain